MEAEFKIAMIAKITICDFFISIEFCSVKIQNWKEVMRKLYIHHLWATDNQLITKPLTKRFTQIINETNRCMQTLLRLAARGIWDAPEKFKG